MKLPLRSSLLIATLFLSGSLPVTAADSAAGPRVVKIRAGVDNAMKFDVTSIPATPGESLKIVLTNAGTLPKNVMGHNWVLLAAGTDPLAFSAQAAPESASGYIPDKQKAKILAFVALLGPGEIGEAVFTAPTEPGQYPFLCTFPAHCAVGMKGMLVIKK